MKHKGKWSTRILAKYWLLQLPELALLAFILIFVQRWVDLPEWVFWGSLAMWVAKDAVLYLFVWRAYDWDHPEGANALTGSRGVANEPLAPSGYVKVRGELWKAQLVEGCRAIDEGEAVQVRGARGLTLIVQPWDELKEKI